MAAPRLLFENRWQARKVQWLSIGAAVWSVGFVWWGASLIAGPWSEKGDEPYAGAFALVFGLLCAAAMALYRRHYVLRLSSDGGTVHVTTLGWLQATKASHPRQALVSVGRYGDASFRGVRAPWLTLRVDGRRMPYILDAQAERFEEGAICGLVRLGRRH